MRIFTPVLLAVFAPLLLVGCTALDINPTPPSSKNLVRGADIEINKSIGTYPAIVLRSFQGVPQPYVRPLRRALTDSAPGFGFRISANPRDRYVYAFTGDFGAIKEANANIISYRWTITDADGKFVHSFLGNLRGGFGATHPWQGFKASEFQRLSRESLSRFDSWLKQNR